MPYPRAEQLVSIQDDLPGVDAHDVGMSQPEWEDLKIAVSELKEQFLCEDRILVDLKARKDKFYSHQPYPMEFPAVAIPLPPPVEAQK